MTLDQNEIVAIIEEITHHRGWISNSYAQIEFLLGDLIIRCREFNQYDGQTKTFTHSATRRVSKIRCMLAIDGPLSPYSHELGEVLTAFEANHDVRNLLAHGFCVFHHTPTGDAGFVFRKFERGDASKDEEADMLVQRTFRLVDMHYHKEQLAALAQRAVEVFAKIHAELGWVA